VWHALCTTFLRFAIRLQIEHWEVKDHLKLPLLQIYHSVIRSECTYLILAKVLSLRNCGTGHEPTSFEWFSFLMGSNRVQWLQFSSNPYPDRKSEFGTIAYSNPSAPDNHWITRNTFQKSKFISCELCFGFNLRNRFWWQFHDSDIQMASYRQGVREILIYQHSK